MVPEASAPNEEESTEEAPEPVIATKPATAKATKIRPTKIRRLEKMEPPQSTAPTVRLASGNGGRMRIAV